MCFLSGRHLLKYYANFRKRQENNSGRKQVMKNTSLLENPKVITYFLTDLCGCSVYRRIFKYKHTYDIIISGGIFVHRALRKNTDRACRSHNRARITNMGWPWGPRHSPTPLLGPEALPSPTSPAPPLIIIWYMVMHYSQCND